MPSVCDGDEFSEKDNPLHLMMAVEVRRRLEVSLMQLKSRTRTILVWRFGLVGKEKTFREIAHELNISVERVRQIYHKAIRELRVLRPLRTYGDIPESTFEAMKHIEPPYLPQLTVKNKADSNKTEEEDVPPERVIDLRDYLDTRVIIKIVKHK